MIRQALHAYAASTGRVFTDDRLSTLGASEVGQCARKIFFSKNEQDLQVGAARDIGYVDSWGAMLRGRLFEDFFWTPALRARYGEKLLFAGNDQRTLVAGFLSATPDALVIDLTSDALAHLGVPCVSGPIVLECKTVDPRTRLDEPKLENVFQVQCQMGLLRNLTQFKPEWAIVSYANASFLDDIIEFPIKFDSQVFATAKQRATQIMAARSAEELRPEGWIAGGRECEYCPYTQACGQMRHAVPTPVGKEPPQDPQFIAENANLARAQKRQRHEAETAAAALRQTEHEIKERLRSRRLRQVTGDDFKVTWSSVKGRPSYDVPAIREAAQRCGLDLSQFETVGDPVGRLTISIRADASRAA
jgi:hypothetical protein